MHETSTGAAPVDALELDKLELETLSKLLWCQLEHLRTQQELGPLQKGRRTERRRRGKKGLGGIIGEAAAAAARAAVRMAVQVAERL